MNLMQLVLKQMRQRALGTWLTLLSVVLGVSLGISILILRRESGSLFGQTDYGYDVLIGNKRSPLQLVLNTVYHIDRSPGNIPYSLYENMMRNPAYRPAVKIAVPFAVGDSYKNHRIVATLPKLFGVDEKGQPLPAEKILNYRPGRNYELAAGNVFNPEKFEAVLGAEVPQRTGLKLGDMFQATHGLPEPGAIPDIHEQKWTVVGILKPTQTASDRALFISLTSFYTIAEHDAGMIAQAALRKSQGAEEKPDENIAANTKPFELRADGSIDLKLPREVWSLSGIMVKSRSAPMAMSLLYTINNGNEAAAVNPATVMREFCEQFLKGPTLVLLVISMLVTGVAAIGILVGIYNSVTARMREIAIFRALGATRRTVFCLICMESGMIGLAGGVLGLVAGHFLAAVGSVYFNAFIGESIDWSGSDRYEWYYVLGVVAIALIAGILPAVKAYQSPVAILLEDA